MRTVNKGLSVAAAVVQPVPNIYERILVEKTFVSLVSMEVLSDR